jgi:hypothetical protein
LSILVEVSTKEVAFLGFEAAFFDELHDQNIAKHSKTLIEKRNNFMGLKKFKANFLTIKMYFYKYK